ncbi:hypothetical protein JVU11DRAFT_3984 [Chiua virens]|nr:hypothetical protein JVU11DRAFT_3984 [Chiua virens]
MKFVILFTALIAAVPAALGLTVNTPGNVVECQPTQISWSGGTGPFYLSLEPAGQTSATPLMTFPTQNGNSYTWTVNVATGTSFTIALKDSTGSQAFSDIVTVQGGSDTSCLSSSAQASGTSGSSAASTGSSSGSTTSAAAGGSSTTATTKASSGSATSAGAPSSTSSSSSSSSKSSGAGRLTVSAFGAACLMGAVGAALF